MSANLSAARSALKLGFFVSSLTAASLGARLATADISPGGESSAFGVAAARAVKGDLSDQSLRQTFNAEGSDLFARHDPGIKQPIAFDILKGYEQAAPLDRWTTLTPMSAQAANQAMPVSDQPILPAKPFVFRGTAADKQAAVTCLTQAVYYEAGFEPIQGAQAVAQVVLNRVRHPVFPKSVCGVVYQGAQLKTGCQFSFACDGSLSKTPASGAWDRAKAVAEKALGGYVAKDVGEATHYHTDQILPWWAPAVTKIAQVGTQIFYRWPGVLGMPSAFNGRYAGGEHVGGGVQTAPDMPATTLASAETRPETRGGRVHVVLAANILTAPVSPPALTPPVAPTLKPAIAPTDGPAAKAPDASLASAPVAAHAAE